MADASFGEEFGDVFGVGVSGFVVVGDDVDEDGSGEEVGEVVGEFACASGVAGGGVAFSGEPVGVFFAFYYPDRFAGVDGVVDWRNPPLTVMSDNIVRTAAPALSAVKYPS